MTTKLAEELAEAEKAAEGPRQQVAVLQRGLQAAIAGGQFDQAQAHQAELDAANEAMVLAEARVSVLREAAAKLDRERTAAAQRLSEAQQVDQANRDLVDAQGDAAQALSQMNAAVAEMRSALAAARRHLRVAETFQGEVTQARTREHDAKRRLGYWPAHHPGPPIARATNVTTLMETDQMVRALVRNIQ